MVVLNVKMEHDLFTLCIMTFIRPAFSTCQSQWTRAEWLEINHFRLEKSLKIPKGYTEAAEGQTMQWQNGKVNMKDFALTISIKEPWWILYSKQFTDAFLSYDCNEPSFSWSCGSWIYPYLCNLHIITKVVSSNPTHGNVYSIQLFVIVFQKLAAGLGQWFPPSNKTARHNITEILLQVVLNTITLTFTL
jgi:hypothetical protein